jgi:peroxiredoxin
VKSAKTEFDRRKVSIVVVSFAEQRQIVRYADDHRWPLAIFTDPERTVYRAFGLQRLPWLRVFSPATLRLYFRSRHGVRQRGYGKEDIYQGGGDFLIDRMGNIHFAHRSRDPADRPKVRQLLQEIDRAQSQG